MVKTRWGFDRGMALFHTPTRWRSTRSSAFKQGQEGHADSEVPLVAEPLNVVVPPKFKVSSENTSSSEEISNFA